MRTKVLALSALLGALGAGSAIAQTNVYSLNAVGYINLTLSPGFNMICCQLITSNNTVGSLFNDASGIYDNCTFAKFNNATGHYTQTDTGDSQGSGYANGWDGNGVMTLNPGETVWFNNAATSNLVVTFVGTVPQGTNTIPLVHGFNMISSPVPFSGDLVTNMGFEGYEANADGSTAAVWNNPATGHPRGAYQTYTVDIAGGGGSGYNGDWDAPGDPKLNVGQGLWFNATAAFNWVQVFSVNP